MLKGDGKDCHFCEHWAYYHKDDLQDLSCIQIYFLDSCEDPCSAEEVYPLLRKSEVKFFPSGNWFLSSRRMIGGGKFVMMYNWWW